ncbi:methylenetetrahydrofolate reductase [Marinoscillum sp. MHG1-6]|uniref:methylenetetrahydrofolate reductase n=1 Tax=Marinoscillum sp. MHG1-6 TaxID=2959627 RepID=UPI002157C75F|nr:methylenetetrahydrofolate reductase [Marinoscillum sp. MHG1-6]
MRQNTHTGKLPFGQLLEDNRFILSAELTPPRHYDLTDFMNKAEIVNEYVDIVQINDHLLSKARLTNLIAGQQCKLAGMEPVLQFALRHKNRIAIQGDLLGLAAMGMENLIILGGYPCSIGSDAEAVDVHDLDSLEAVRKISRLTKSGELFNGEVISPPPRFNIGVVEFPCSASHMEQNLDRLEEKIDAGASYVQVQAVFEVEPLHSWMSKVRERGLHHKARFLGAVFPFNGLERLNALTEIPGLEIPHVVRRRLQMNDTESESLQITLELIREISRIEGISGLHIRSIGAEAWVPRIIEASGLGGVHLY